MVYPYTDAPEQEKSRITKRVIAPFVRIVRKKKPSEDVDSKKPKRDEILRNLSAFLLDSYDLAVSLYDTCEVIKDIIEAMSFTLFLTDPSSNEIYESRKFPIKERYRVKWKIEQKSIVAAYVAACKTYVMVDDVLLDDRFPEGTGYGDSSAKSVMSVPIISPENDCIAVIEFYKNIFCAPFTKDNLELVVMISSWMGLAISENQQGLALQRQQDLNTYLSDLTKYYFEDLNVLEKMTKEIIRNVKDTLQAERASVYVLDKENESTELVADLFEETRPEEIERFQRVKFGKERVIAGTVAKSGEKVNLKDAYLDVVRQTEGTNKVGFIIRSILCMPIMGDNDILGVIQTANKSNGGYFTATDENLLKTFTDFQALVLYCTRITKMRSEKALMTSCYRQWMAMNYVPCRHDLYPSKHSIRMGPKTQDFAWYHTPKQVDCLPQFCLQMFLSVLPETDLNLTNLHRFILTVRKFYAQQPQSFFSFENAFNRFHCIVTIIRKNLQIFTNLEIKAFMIAGLCHDIDHYGLSGNYLYLVHDDLAQIYNFSIMENHHYDVTMMLLKNYDIYHNLNDHEWSLLKQEIKELILATDLAQCSEMAFRIKTAQDSRLINWLDPQQRMDIKRMIMIAGALSSSCKSFLIAKKITKWQYDERYKEGDMILDLNLCPLSNLNGQQKEMIPENEVNFLTFMVIPCMKLLKFILPNTEDLYRGALDLKDAWNDIISVRGKKCWRQDISIVRK